VSRNIKNNNLPKNAKTKNMVEIKPNKNDKNKNINFIKKNKSSNTFIQVNTKRKSLLKNYDLNKVTLIQKSFKKYFINKKKIENKNNSIIQ
jgi:hypothetical protein